MKKQTQKRWMALGAVLIVLAGIGMAVSDKDQLQGSVSNIEFEFEEATAELEIPLATDVVTYDSATNHYHAGLAQGFAAEAEAWANEASQCADRLDAYYDYGATNCTDTDGGEDYDNAGEVTGTSWYDGSSWDGIDDFCQSSDTLIEYYCIDDANSAFDGYAYGEAVECELGCSDGACIQEENECDADSDCGFGYTCSSTNTCEAVGTATCEDSDGGIDIYEEAYVQGTDYEDYNTVTSATEFCIDDDTVMEYWCPSSGKYEDFLYFEEFDCPDNYACQDGACINILSNEDYECEEPFRDTDDEMVCRAYNAGIISGKTRTKYDPYAGITRAEVIKIIILTMGEDPSWSDQGILDMDASHWAWGYVNRAKELGIITERTFNPDLEVTRGTTMVWLVRAADETLPRSEWENRIPWSDMTVQNDSTYAAIIGNDTIVDFFGEEIPVAQGYSDGTFKPDNSIIRYEALYLAYRSYLAWFENTGSFED